MEFLKNIVTYIRQADRQDIYLYIGIASVLFLLLLSSIWYLTNRRTHFYKNAIQKIHQQQKTIKSLLAELHTAQEQQEQVEDIIAENKNFRILPEYETILSQVNLKQYQADKPTLADGTTINGKTEKMLTSSLNGITMKQLTQLLSAITQVKRIYPKILNITKSPRGRLIDMELTIATLEPAEPY